MRLHYALLVSAVAVHAADAATQCAFNIQTKLMSTLQDPPTDVVVEGSSQILDVFVGSTSFDGSVGDLLDNYDDAITDATSAGGSGLLTDDSSLGGVDVPNISTPVPVDGSLDLLPGEPGSKSKDKGSGSSTPGLTIPNPVSGSSAKSEKEDKSGKSASGSTNSPAPTTTAPSPSTDSKGSLDAAVPLDGLTRRLQVNAGSLAGVENVAGVDPVGSTLGSSSVSSDVLSSGGSGSNSDGNMACDEDFYKKWNTLGIKCLGEDIDVGKAVDAAACVIYSGNLGVLSGHSCVSICSFPGCTNDGWDYSVSNGFASPVYRDYQLSDFMSRDMTARMSTQKQAPTILSNTSMTSSQQCSYNDEDSFSSCDCSSLLVTGTEADAERDRIMDWAQGIIPDDDTSLTGKILAPVSKSLAGAAVAMSGIAVVASSVVSSASAAAGAAGAGAGSVGIYTIDICGFGVMINQLDLQGRSAVLTNFGESLAPSTFIFMPFGKINDDEKDKGTSDVDRRTRRLMEGSETLPDSGIAKYARIAGFREDMLFVVTLAGVVVIMASILAAFFAAYLIAGFFMSRETFMDKFFDKMVSLQVLVAILSQYTIGVTATYQIYHSIESKGEVDAKCILAFAAIIFLALGIMVFGLVVIKRNEDKIQDVGQPTHVNKWVCKRYGPLYDEYTYDNRFFFASKMLLALATGVITGFVGLSSTTQVSLLLACQVIFFFYLEYRSPHHSKFIQRATSFVSVMKITVLILTFFLISAATANGLPSDVQNGISLAIVGLNVFVLFLMLLRAVYNFWHKFQMQRKGQEYENEAQSARDYFKDETPQKEAPQTNQGSYFDTSEPAPEGEDIRLRSGTHFNDSNNYANYQPQSTAVGQAGSSRYLADDIGQQGRRQNPYDVETSMEGDVMNSYQRTDSNDVFRPNNATQPLNPYNSSQSMDTYQPSRMLKPKDLSQSTSDYESSRPNPYTAHGSMETSQGYQQTERYGAPPAPTETHMPPNNRQARDSVNEYNQRRDDVIEL